MADKIKISISKRIVFNGQEVNKTAEAEITEEQGKDSRIVDQIIRGLFEGLFYQRKNWNELLP